MVLTANRVRLAARLKYVIVVAKLPRR